MVRRNRGKEATLVSSGDLEVDKVDPRAQRRQKTAQSRYRWQECAPPVFVFGSLLLTMKCAIDIAVRRRGQSRAMLLPTSRKNN